MSLETEGSIQNESEIANIEDVATTPVPVNNEVDTEAKEASSQKTLNISNENNRLSDTPYIPQEVYVSLPKVLKEATLVITDNREKDLLLTSSIATIGGCLSNVHGYYDGDTIYPNLFFLGLAPPASGKSRAKFSRKLVEGVDQMTHEQSKERVKKYLASKSEEKEGIKGALIDEPAVQSLFIAGNTSSAAIITSLYENHGVGILFETEADTLTNSLKQDWGGFSDLVRKSFHSEPYLYTRKGTQSKKNAVQIRIEEPKLAIVLTGTPSQLVPLIHSQEDGFFSRFIYYAYEKAIEYKPVSQTKGGLKLNEYYSKLSEEITTLYEAVQDRQIVFSISAKQEDELNDLLKFYHIRLTTFVSNDTQSFINRMGTIGYKIALILSVIRSFEADILTNEIECAEQDFQITLSLMKVFLSHSETVYKMLPKKSNNEIQKTNLKIYQSLPMQFRRQELLVSLKTWKISERTLDNYLKEWLDKGLLVKDRHGMYEKIA